ncbi:MAG TPA: biopolymer transporter ExbD [Acidobacteriota bacterium]|nr:biopolymer transporter ExbD [Acidobacteriota bacterium]
MAIRTEGTRSSLSEINVTPLVDVVLVLLIIFMVTAPIIQTGIEVSLPRTRTATAQDPEQLAVITITRDDVLYYRSKPVNFNNLGQLLQQDLADRTQPVFLQADEDTRWKTIVTVLDEIRASGYENVKFPTKPLAKESR